MRRRTSIEAWATVLFGGVLPLVFSTRCSNPTPPVAPSAEPAVALQDRPDELDEDLLDAYGCNAKYTVCINACTAVTISARKSAPIVAEGQKVKIRAIGWESCRPKAMTCKSHNVLNLNTRFQNPDSPPPAPARVDPHLAAAKTGLAAPTPAPMAAPSAVLPERQAVEDARTMLNNAFPDKPRADETQALKDALNSLHKYLEWVGQARQSFVTAAWGADAVKKTEGIAANKAFSDDVRQGAQKASDRLRNAKITPELLGDELNKAKSGAERALLNLRALKAARDKSLNDEKRESLSEKQAAEKEFDKVVKASAPPSSASGARQEDAKVDVKRSTEVARRHHRAAEAHREAEKNLEKAKSELEEAINVTDRYVMILAGVIARVAHVRADSAIDLAHLQAADDQRVVAEQAVNEAIAVDVLAVQASEDAARVNKLSLFGDCVLQVPAEESLREVVVKVEFTRAGPAPTASNAASGGGASAAPPASTDPVVADNGIDQADLNRKAALVHVTIDHGKYYYDVGIVTAMVPRGGRSIATPARPGLEGDRAIEVVEESKIVTGAALNLYPWGHRRGAYSAWEGRTLSKARWGDALSFQVAVNPNPNEILSTLFVGGSFEPVTGVALSTGALLLQGDFLRGGYVEGMSPASSRDDYVVSKPMLRPYFGVTLGFELVHTTATRLQTKTQNGSKEENGP